MRRIHLQWKGPVHFPVEAVQSMHSLVRVWITSMLGMSQGAHVDPADWSKR